MLRQASSGHDGVFDVTATARRHPGIFFVKNVDGRPDSTRQQLTKAVRRHAMLATLAEPAVPAFNEVILNSRSVSQAGRFRDYNLPPCAVETACEPFNSTIVPSKQPRSSVHNRKRCHFKVQRQSLTTASKAQNDDTCVSEALSPVYKIRRSAALPTTGPSFPAGPLNMAETAQWLFCSHLRSSQTPFFAAAKSHWVDRLWDAATQHPLVLRCLSLSMLHKKAALLGKMDWTSYFAEKVTLMQDLQTCLTSNAAKNLESDLPLAITMLAELETRDAKDMPSARVHMNALARLVRIEQLHDLAWRIAVRVDLRQALFSSERPNLPYWVPLEYKKPLMPEVPTWQRSTCSHLACENSRRTPKSAAFPEEGSRNLFRDMHSLAFCWDRLIIDEIPPFGHVYNLAYRIRVATADIRAAKGQDIMNVAVELTIIAFQLHLWILSRFWVAQSRKFQAKTLQRGFDLLKPDILAEWQTCASPWSLLWVLITLAAARFDICTCDDRLLNDLLARTCERLDIRNLPELVAELKRWPWVQNWHPARVEMVWMELSKIVDGAETVTQVSAETLEFSQALETEQTRERSWFLGGLEFYNSL